jgi:oligopeptide transport system ATP-binding protein
MYAGHIVETAPLKEFYANPRHPYSIGLFMSLPRLDAETHQKLISIEGLPPNLIDMPDCCPFVTRCKNVIEKCKHKNPPLRHLSDSHLLACWVDVPQKEIT